jgi:hypothetical protein
LDSLTLRTSPTVTAIVAAYNYERYLAGALDSALGQDYPAERLDVVVVDDGSTDATPEILAEYEARHPGRVRSFRQQNAGYVAATNRALKEARGELIAILDADDVWHPHKTRAQVDLLLERPEVGAVYGDMTLIDGDGRVVADSTFRHYGVTPVRGRALGTLIVENRGTASSVMVRAALRRYYDPIPADVPYADWWLMARAGTASCIDYVEEPCSGYRIHGGNLTGGATGARKVREAQKELQQQRALLAAAELRHPLGGAEVAAAFERLHQTALAVMAVAGTPFVELVRVSDDQRSRSRELCSAGVGSAAAGDVDVATRELAHAFALDPWNGDAARAFRRVSAQPFSPPSAVAAARSFRTLAFGEEVVERPELLAAYASQFAATDDATLVIVLPPGDGRLVEALERAASNACLTDAESADVLAITAPEDERGEARLVAAVQAVLSGRTPDVRHPHPWFAADGAPGLRAMAARFWRGV